MYSGGATVSGGFVNRVLNAVGSFFNAWSTYNIASTEFGYDAYAARMWRYNQAIHYYSNTAYSLANRYAEVYKQQHQLYKHIRSIYNPVARIVDFYPGKVYGGNIDMEKLTTGAIPLPGIDSNMRQALIRLLQWSNWGTQKALFVRQGALFGDTAIKIVDDRAHQHVRMEVLDPRKIKYIKRDAVGNVSQMIIEYTDYEEVQKLQPESNPSSQPYLYTEIIDLEQFQTFKNGKPFAYFADDSGAMVDHWPNEYGFVPVSAAQHKNMGMEFGAASFNTSMPKIDELNDSASLLNDQIRKHVNTVWWAAGVNAGNDISSSTDSKDAVPMVYAPEGSQPYAMVARIDISAAIANLNMMITELESDLPELSLHRIRDKGQMTAPGVTAGYSDAIDRINEARANYDDAMTRAMQMAVAIGGYNGYSGFERYSLDQYKNGDLAFHIGNRPVIDDSLSELEKVQVLADTGAPKEVIWGRLGYDDDTVAAWAAQSAANPMTITPVTPLTDSIAISYPQPPGLPPGAPVRSTSPVIESPAPRSPVNNAPAIKGAKLPTDQALKVNPILKDEMQAMLTLHRRMVGAK